MVLKNTTATLVESFGSTEGRLVRLEVLLLFSTLAWVLLELCGSYRRRYSHGFSRLLVWMVYTLYTVLVPYTIGLLQAGSFRDQTFVLWGTFLLLIQVNPESLSVYSIRDTEQRKRLLVQQVLQISLVLWLMINGNGGNQCYSATIWILWINSIILTYRKFRTKGSNMGGLVAQSKVIADYMGVEHELDKDDDYDPSTMKGYRYIFYGVTQLERSLCPAAPDYRAGLSEVTNHERVLTIDSVWRWIDSQRFSRKETQEDYKDTALSFTFFQLLKRRFCGYGLGEAGRDKTLHLVLHGLLTTEDNYARAFHVIELELAFLYDFFYTRMATRSFFWMWYIPSIIVVVVWNSISGAFSKNYHRSNLEQRVNGTDVIHWITIVLLASLIFAHFVGAFQHPRRFIKVLQLCRWIFSSGPNQRTKTISHGTLTNDTWQKKLGQYSLLHNFDYDPHNILSYMSLGLIEAKRKGQKALEKIKLEEEVIKRVLSQFKKNNGNLENGQSALARNRLANQFSWASTLPTHIHTILVWHIATTIISHDTMIFLEEKISREDAHFINLWVVSCLSEYCAYLVAFVPDMLPGHGYDTQCIFDTVVMEARQQLGGCQTTSSRFKKLATLEGNDGTILGMGAKLGRQLKERFQTNSPIDSVPHRVQIWKALADFWAEFILFLAPSDNADIHAEKLAAGGEFMTHLWVLLTHAGILERPSSSSGDSLLGGFNGTTTQDSAV